MQKPQTTPCKACGKAIIFAESSASGKMMPVDAETTENGNVYLELRHRKEPLAMVFGKGSRDLAAFRSRGEGLHVSHFVTCSDPDRFHK